MPSAPMFAIIVALAGVADASAVAGEGRPTMADFNAGKAAAAEKAEVAAANEAKMAAVNKVINMLEDLRSKVQAEGAAEAATYQKVCEMCQTAKREKSSAIADEKDEKTRLSAEIKKLEAEKKSLDKAIKKNVENIDSDEKTMTKLDRVHAKDTSTYNVNKADVTSAVNSLRDAIGVMKSGKSASLLQVQSIGKSVQQALLLGDALGLMDVESQKATSFFLQQDSHGAPAVEMENFKFHSGGIISTLEKLQGDFRKMSQDVDAAQVKRVSTYNQKTQHFTDQVKANTHQMEAIDKVARSEAIEDIGSATQALREETALLRDDQGFLDSMNTMCKQKEAVYNQRSKTRNNELTALTKALVIIKNTVAEKTSSSTVRLFQSGVAIGLADAVASSDSAMEAIEAEAESNEESLPAVGFLQKRAVKNHPPKDEARELVLAFFKSRGKELHSVALTELAGRIAADPFAKIKKLVQELIERQLSEAANEANQKGWCDKATADAKQKREYSSDSVADLNARMGKLEATSDQLSEEIDTLTHEIAEINEEVKEANAQRTDEQNENAETVKEAKAGKAAVAMAIDILSKFYGTARNKAAKIDEPEKDLDKYKRVQSNEQARAGIGADCKRDCSGLTTKATSKCKAEEAQCIEDATAEVDKTKHAEDSKSAVAEYASSEGQDAQMDEAYAGSSAAAGGILAMMEVIESDFDRTISETQKAEEELKQEHYEFLTKSQSSLAQKTVAVKEKTKLQGEADQKHSEDEDELSSQVKILQTSLKELMELQTACQPKGQSYQDRVAKREDEIASLNKGMCLLEKFADPSAKAEC